MLRPYSRQTGAFVSSVQCGKSNCSFFPAASCLFCVEEIPPITDAFGKASMEDHRRMDRHSLGFGFLRRGGDCFPHNTLRRRPVRVGLRCKMAVIQWKCCSGVPSLHYPCCLGKERNTNSFCPVDYRGQLRLPNGRHDGLKFYHSLWYNVGKDYLEPMCLSTNTFARIAGRTLRRLC